HFSMSAINRQHCPGPYPWDALWKYLQGGAQPMAPTPQQDAEARLCWASFFTGIGQKPPVTGTGIFQAWVSAWINEGRHYGPPITHEYDSNDWSGNHIVCQEFAHARCEWQNGTANWYTASGKI